MHDAILSAARLCYHREAVAYRKPPGYHPILHKLTLSCGSREAAGIRAQFQVRGGDRQKFANPSRVQYFSPKVQFEGIVIETFRRLRFVQSSFAEPANRIGQLDRMTAESQDVDEQSLMLGWQTG
jgi:hypothetical protein